MEINRRSIGGFFGVLVFAAIVHADMIPVFQEFTVCRQSQVCYALTDHQCENSPSTYNYTYITDPGLWSVGLLSEIDAETGQNSEVQLHSLTDGSNGLEFCLSALISLGLCCSAHRVKKLPLGFIPEWYHEGRPFQIGHRHALIPGTLCPAKACCFIQTPCTEDNHLPQYYLKTIVSLWRKSQFTPAVTLSRGPPLRS